LHQQANSSSSKQADTPSSKHTSAISISQRLWNAAYDGLERDDATAKLVRDYMKILAKVIDAEKASDPSVSGPDDNSAELKDPVKRQAYMRKLVEEGQKKIATMSKFTQGTTGFIEYLNQAKSIIDLAIGNIPQAALPWAGVCVGLQVRLLSLSFASVVSYTNIYRSFRILGRRRRRILTALLMLFLE
jgi:hypothetical protein